MNVYPNSSTKQKNLEIHGDGGEEAVVMMMRGQHRCYVEQGRQLRKKPQIKT